ncbi:unnamed protein product [Spirodela intermedia]|uniref:Leucine-rich repeat-containing N-terminal plant-type domain-containing protein n=1 Tax=Spirodela intermedia TaxID=51605 RepID=A0A7I8IHM5_SPIIN|nr:unnamed protein product [Spirodela intermedia]CAA6657375.1 unnamed protein product [Spirodela intermedia]
MRRRRWLLGTISSRCSLFASILILLAPICLSSAEQDPAAAERAALLQFKSGVSSDPTGLLSLWRDSAGSDHCSWPGVSCDARSRVSAVDISGGGGDRLLDSALPAPLRWKCSDPAARLAGRLSPAVGRLSELKMLALPCHSFDGEIPGEIWGLQNLEGLRVLNLALNRIRGEVPSSLSRCLNLEMVDLSGNHINGAVPPFFTHLPKLRVLSLSFNRLRGSVPGEIGKGCRSLEHLDLSGNLLVGEIPASLGNCGELRSLLLFSNLLGGLLPPEIGRLTRLQILDVSMNRLSGPVPKELGNCIELSVLVLSNAYRPIGVGGGGGHDNESNHFGGGLPESVTGLSMLRVLWAPRSKLKGRIPSHWGACERLQVLNLAQNLFTGNIPAGLERCKNLKYLNLSSNFLTGRLKEGLPVHSMNVSMSWE